MANPVARVLQAGVAFILAKGDALLCHPGINLLSPDAEEGAHDAEGDRFGAAPGLQRRGDEAFAIDCHPPQPLRAAPAKEIEKEGLYLIIGMMSEEQRMATGLPGHPCEKSIARMACRRLQRLSPSLGERGDIKCLRLK